MSTKLKVTIIGGSGVTGQSIARELLANPGQFEVVALARSASLEKPEMQRLASLGATLLAVDLDGPVENTAKLLAGADVVISTLTAAQLQQELNLVAAAKQAGVGRYVPSFFGPVCPPNGVMWVRDKKEEILNLVKRLYIPYTAIDIGWWYQMVAPRRPQDTDLSAFVQPMPIIADGDVKIAMTDNRDIGKFVARIIADDRTLNRCVFAHGDVKTIKEAWEDVKSVSGTDFVTKHVSEQSLTETLNTFKGDRPLTMEIGMAQYYYSLAIRGDNTPEKARYLGYLNAAELYPDIQHRSWKEYVEDLVAGELTTPYEGRQR